MARGDGIAGQHSAGDGCAMLDSAGGALASPTARTTLGRIGWTEYQPRAVGLARAVQH